MFKNKAKITVSNYFYFTPKRCGTFFLVQAGESFCSADTVIPAHSQRCFELTYAISGEAYCYVNDDGLKIGAGDCFFSFPQEIHKIESDTENPLHFIFLAFYVKDGAREGRYIDFIRTSLAESKKRKIAIGEISDALLKILKELKKSDEYTPRMIRSHLEHILIECCRKIHNKPTSVYPIRYTDAEMLAKDVILYVDENVESISSAADVADAFHYSLPNVSKIFRSQTGLPLGKYISGKRMELASKMLGDGYSVTAVSDKLGYSSIHTFSRAYKLYFHQPPSKKSKDQ